MNDEHTDWMRNLERIAQQAAREFGDVMDRAGRALGRAVDEAGRVAKAQAAMAAAYHADLETLEKVLRGLTPAQLQEISAAAAVVTATADRVLAQTPADDDR
ncbi:hypothetical protein JOL79_30625 [Microbispora sp. RL4-1S]|uniref:Uncharacterized protein n=1 Tax=Microbispora oryzae TaxID=2806554 RepID=A0A940WNH3_9ACTN|nr:hypothetical protein [Microbispora oryzae]MBP2708143.1 hypothetical protein [Microbispora oryzae]